RYSYIDNKPTSFIDPNGFFQDLRGTGGATSADGYGGSAGSGSWAPSSDCVPMDRGGCALSPFPDSARYEPGTSVGAPGSAGRSSDGPDVGEVDVDAQERETEILLYPPGVVPRDRRVNESGVINTGVVFPVAQPPALGNIRDQANPLADVSEYIVVGSVGAIVGVPPIVRSVSRGFGLLAD